MKKPNNEVFNMKPEKKLPLQAEPVRERSLEEITATIMKGREMLAKAFFRGVSDGKKEKP